MQKIIGVIKYFVLAVALLQSSHIQAQSSKNKRQVKGVVMDSVSGSGIDNVNIYVKDDSKVTESTNNRGEYTIAARTRDVLVFMHPDYFPSQMKVRERKDTVWLNRMNRVQPEKYVNTGYVMVAKSKVLGAYTLTEPSQFNLAPVSSFRDALSGRVAGLQISSDDGQPGRESNLILRGASSFTLKNTPLYVIDGFPMEGFPADALNTLDIKSVSVLKDAALTSIYGARGANGVIVIETKKGSTTKPLVQYNASFGNSSILQKADLMTPHDFVKYQLEQNPGLASSLYLGSGQTLDSYKNASGIDWQDELYRTAFIQTHQISLSGMNSLTRYYISGSIFNQDGIIKNSGFERYQGRGAIDQIINKKVKIGLSGNYSLIRNSGQIASAPQADNDLASTTLMYGIWGSRPTTGANENFDIKNSVLDPQANDLRVNPLLSANSMDRNNRQKNFLVNAYLDYNISPDLNFRFNTGVNRNSSRNIGFYGTETRAGIDAVNGAVSYHQLNTWFTDGFLSYKKYFNKDNRLDVIAGAAIQGQNNEIYGLSSSNIQISQLGVSTLDDGIPGPAISMVSKNKLLSFYSTLGYELKSKYFFTASLRADGSSKLAKSNQWGYFPSAGFVWKMNEEGFLKNSTAVSNAKLRLSYGLTGNNSMNDYSRFSVITYSSYYTYNNQVPSVGTEVMVFANNDLKYETTTQSNIGYDLGLLKNRLNLTIDVYRRTTKDVLFYGGVPSSGGFSVAYQNGAKVQNEGLELGLSTINVTNKKFSWASDFNIAFNRNKVLQLAKGQGSLLSSLNWNDRFNDALYMLTEGEAMSNFYGYVWDGVYQYADFDQQLDGSYVLKSDVTNNGADRFSIQPGDIKYRDLNDDLVIDEKDRIVIGRSLPKHIGGFNNRFKYKQFSLEVLLQWSYGNDLYNANRIVFEGNENNYNSLNQYASYNDRWSSNNQGSKNFRTGGQGPADMYSSRVIEDGSYLRLKTMCFSWSVPKPFVQKIKAQSVDLYLTAHNLYTWTKYTGSDPEVSIYNSALTQGFDYSSYPRARVITIGLSASL